MITYNVKYNFTNAYNYKIIYKTRNVIVYNNKIIYLQLYTRLKYNFNIV
jgi:hypothetical protein